MNPQRLVLALLASTACATCPAFGQAIPLDCSSQIPGGGVVDFEQPAGNVNEVLPDFDMIASPDALVTTMVGWVAGNGCAPIANQAGFGDGVVISTTGEPWGRIGVSAVGTILGQDRQLTMNVFSEDGTLLGTVTRVFSPGTTQGEYNDAAVFLGFESAAPIHSFQILADNPNIAWDEIRFQSEPGFLRGDADGNGSFSGLADGLFILNYQFVAGSPEPPCLDAADFDDSGGISGLVDGLALLNFQFVAGSPPPPPPGPTVCGPDPTDDPLGCGGAICP